MGNEEAKRKTVRKRSGVFAPGTAPGPGRTKGEPNKLSGEVRRIIESALIETAGEVPAALRRSLAGDGQLWAALSRVVVVKQIQADVDVRYEELRASLIDALTRATPGK